MEKAAKLLEISDAYREYLKYEALYCELLGETNTDRAGHFWRTLETCNGTAVGSFTGDECLSGIGANRGTELWG